MTHTASVNCVPRTNLLVSVFLSFKIYAHISTWKLIPFLLHEKRHTLVWSMNWQSRVRAKKNRKFPARSDLSLHIQKVRTPGKDRHQHYSNCLERNNNNRCICVIHSYDMSLSLCSFVIRKLAVKTSRLHNRVLDRKDFIKTNLVLSKTLVIFGIILT